MSDQTHPAPQAPQTGGAPAPAPAAEASRQPSPSAAATATATAPHPSAPASTPATAPSATTVPSPASHNVASEHPQTFNEKLNAADRYWKFKVALRSVLVIVGLIGVGVTASLVGGSSQSQVNYDYGPGEGPWYNLITFGISIIWCAACVLVLVLRKRPVHPGARVAMDLLIWLGFIASVLFATAAYLDRADWDPESYSSGGSNSSSDGGYQLQSNGTLVWENGSNQNTRSCDRTSGSSSFASCADQDAYVNKLWQENAHRVSLCLAGVICQYIALILHLTLFIWACVDCSRHNRTKTSQDAEKLAANIVQTMIQNGAIIPPPGQAHMRPIPYGQPGNYALPRNYMYPMAPGQLHYAPNRHPTGPVYSQHAPNGQPMVHHHGAPQMHEQRPALPPRPSAGPVNEKSEGLRYA